MTRPKTALLIRLAALTMVWTFGCAGERAPDSVNTVSATPAAVATATASQPLPSESPATSPTPARVPTFDQTAPPLPSVQATSPPQVAAVVSRGPATRQLVALTFDAGADAGFTSEILDTLQAESLQASFGITGRWAEQNPELVRRIVRQGHHLINHTYSHDSFTGRSTNRTPMSRAERWAELDRTAEAVQDIAGVEIGPYFRPPYGDYDPSVNADIAARGYYFNVMWTVDSFGWRGIPASEIVSRCLENAQAGAIYIFHVGSASQDGSALPAIIAGLKRLGYEMG